MQYTVHTILCIQYSVFNTQHLISDLRHYKLINKVVDWGHSVPILYTVRETWDLKYLQKEATGNQDMNLARQRILSNAENTERVQSKSSIKEQRQEKDQAQELFVKAGAENELGLENKFNDTANASHIDLDKGYNDDENDDDYDEDGDSSSLDIDEEKDPDFPVGAYILLNVLLIIWGLIGTSLTTSLHLSHHHTEELLLVDPISLDLPPYILYSSCVLSLCTSILAITFILAESASFFSVIPHINGLVGALTAVSSICGSAAWSNPDVRIYQRLLEAEAFVRKTGDKYYILNMGKEYEGYWDKLQTTLHCCGVEGPNNWIKSMCNCIPDSCCIESTKKECLKRIQQWNLNSSVYYHNFSYVKDYIWHENCLEVMNQEMLSLKRDWISFPLIILFFYMLLVFNVNYIVVAVRNRYNIVTGFKVIKDIKIRMRGKFAACCCLLCNWKKKAKKKNRIAAEQKQQSLLEQKDDEKSVTVTNSTAIVNE